MKSILFSLWASASVSLAGAGTLTEDFATDPAMRGWQTLGDTNLFHWNSTNQNLEVTWDSSQPNSYFYHPLGATLTAGDDFSLAFDLQLSDAEVGGYGFEIAIGLLNFADATGTNFLRGTGANSPNLIEFDYFPDAGFGPSIDASMADAAGNFQFIYDSLPLANGTLYHVTIQHMTGSPLVSAEVSANGNLYSILPNPYLNTNFTDFRLDTVSISSYSGAESGGSILVHGAVDNLVVALQPPAAELAGKFTGSAWQVQFVSRTNWAYVVERTTDFRSWIPVSATLYGNGGVLSIQDTNAPARSALYRARTIQP